MNPLNSTFQWKVKYSTLHFVHALLDSICHTILKMWLCSTIEKAWSQM